MKEEWGVVGGWLFIALYCLVYPLLVGHREGQGREGKVEGPLGKGQASLSWGKENGGERYGGGKKNDEGKEMTHAADTIQGRSAEVPRHWHKGE